MKTHRPTLKDLADAAGVGVATVDRVLNDRQNVSNVTKERVLVAANRIGYPTGKLQTIKINASRPIVRFGFVLHKSSQEFYRNFADALEVAVKHRMDIRGTCSIRFSPSQAPSDFAAELSELSQTTDVLAT